jgi:transposase
VRLKKGTRLTEPKSAAAQIKAARPWPERQWQVVEILLEELSQAHAQRQRWHSLIAQEVLADPALLNLVRLCGIREMTAFALGAFIGDIRRFAGPKKLVKYIGLDPAFDHSGQGEWNGGIGGHGNKHLRCLLIEGAQALLRCSKTSLARWGKKLLARKGALNIAVAAVARKLAVAAWHTLMGHITPALEIEPRVLLKVGKMIGEIGKETMQKLGRTPKQFKAQACLTLQSSRIYMLESLQT